EGAEPVPATEGDAEAGGEEEGEAAQNGDRPGQPELLADGGEDEVGLGIGDEVGTSQAGPRPRQAAGAESEQPLSDLVAGVGVVGERVEPRLHPALDVVEQPPSRQTPAGGEQTPGDEITGGSGGGVEQGGEGQEEEERRAEVALVDEDQEAPRPHRDQRDELAGLGDADRAELAVGAGEG